MILSLTTALLLLPSAAVMSTSTEPPAVMQADSDYADLDAEETAFLFWNSAIDGDWETLRALCPYGQMERWFRTHRPVEILAIGKPFTRDDYAGVYVPYKIRFEHRGKRFVKKHNLALRNDNGYGHYVFDGGV